jgi:hypothetical protein
MTHQKLYIFVNFISTRVFRNSYRISPFPKSINNANGGYRDLPDFLTEYTEIHLE